MKRIAAALSLCLLGQASAAILTIWTHFEPAGEIAWVKAQAAAFEKATGNGKFGYLTEISEPYRSYCFVRAYGGYVFRNNAGTLDPKDLGLNNAGTVKALLFLNDLRYKYNPAPERVDAGVARSAFIYGRLAMLLTGP